MRIPEKQNALIVKGVVIPCGITDKTNDKPQSKQDIKKIFTNYLAHETDVQHSWVNNFGVYTLENTLTEHETIIANQKVPIGSWTASHLVVNPDIKQMVKDESLNGYSLGAVNDKQLNENVNFLNKSLRYEDLNDAEELNPLFISFVESPANGFRWEVYDYNSFLEKSYNNLNGDKMTDETTLIEKNNEKGFVSEGFLERVLGNFLSKSEEEPSEEKDEDNEEVLEKDDDITNKELLEQLPQAVATAVIEALNQLAKKDDSQDTGNDDDDETMSKSVKSQQKDKSNFMEKSTTKNVQETFTPKKDNYSFLNSDTRDRFGRNKKYL